MDRVVVWGWDAGGVCGRVANGHEAMRKNVRLKVHGYRRGAPEHIVKVELFDGNKVLRTDEVSSVFFHFDPELVFVDAKQLESLKPIERVALAD